MNFPLQVAQLQEKVIANDYYTRIWDGVLKVMGMDRSGVSANAHDTDKLRSFVFEFWAALPDSMSIRREPFFELCDLCEQDFEE